MRRWIYDFCRPLARRRRHLPESVGHLHAVNQPIICNGLENSDRNMYRLPVARCNDARLGGGPPPAEGPRAHADRARATLERQPVDDCEDREETDESLLRRRPARDGVPPGRAEATGEEGARRSDPDEEGPVRRSEDPPRDRSRRDAPLEVLPDARHAQRPPGRLDLGQGDQQPDPVRQRPEGPRADPRGRGDGARIPSGRCEGAGREIGEPAATLQCRPRDGEGRGHRNRDEVGLDEAPVRSRIGPGADSHTPSLSLNNDNTSWNPTQSGEIYDDRLRVLCQDGSSSAVSLFLALRRSRRATAAGRGVRRPGKRLGEPCDGGSQGRSVCGASEDRDGSVRRAHAVGDGHSELMDGASVLSLANDNDPVDRDLSSRPHSGYGTSTSRKSSATRTFAKTVFASSRIDVGSSYRGLRWVNTSRPTPDSFAVSAACLEDECP